MRPPSPRVLLGLACLGALTGSCFGSALFRNEQFAFRDAGHFYYPLYQRVQQEWDAGRLPLWEPEENAGMPLLGNPSAAVLYPGKLVFARPMPYPWGMRLYVVGHVLLAVAGMYALVRSWEISRTGSTLAAFSYGFGAPVLFQYCNVIFLVGAAWMPLGLRAADRWLRLGRRWALGELAVVLAMQALGGDPQAAYLTGLCAAGYALGLASWGRPSRRAVVATGGGLALAAVAAVLVALSWRVRWAAFAFPKAAIPTAWGLAALAVLSRARRADATMPRRLIGLALACGLGLALSAAQLVPVAEFTGMSMRAAEKGPHDIFPFSVEPYRLLELAWPTFFGPMMLGENRSWIFAIPPAGHHHVWVPSLYLGGLSLVLALGAAGFRNGPAWRGWMTGIAVLSLLAAFGEYGGPVWSARMTPAGVRALGPHDPQPPRAERLDGRIRDGDGSPYWLLAKALPGFGQFRYPGKLLVLSTLALAALAGIGWDRATAGGGPARAWALAGLLVTGMTLAAATADSARIVSWIAETSSDAGRSAFGPIRPDLAFGELRRALVHGGLALGGALAVLLLARRRPREAGVLALVLVTADLAVANARFIQTVPQAAFDSVPKAVRLIREAEAARGKSADKQPFRVHHLGSWEPVGWLSQGSPGRMGDLLNWSRATIQPKFAIPYGINYTAVEGTAELYDYWWFFAPLDPKLDAQAAKALGMTPGDWVVYHPRRGYDLWNARYFLLPVFPGGWKTEHRSYIAFLPRTELLYPKFLANRDPGTEAVRRRWVETQDWQLLRNEAAFPRAWVVHQAHFRPPIDGLRKEDRMRIMTQILYEENPIWHEPLVPSDPHEVAWIETDERGRWAPFATGGAPERSETVTFDRYEPTRVELTARLARPGFVVLADVDYPGWNLTIDDLPAPILRANRLMRGAAVPEGTHTLVYTYDPPSVKIGAAISLAGLMALLGLAIWSARGSEAPRAGPHSRQWP